MLEAGTWTEVAVAVGTLALAAVTAWLAWGARGQVKVAADHVVAIQRPLVVPVATPEWSVTLDQDGFSREEESDWVPLKNIGLGPAYNVEGGLYWRGGAGGASGLQRTALGAGESIGAYVAGVGQVINWADVTGFLRYFDTAGTEWQTHFRFQVIQTVGVEAVIVEVGKTSDLGKRLYSPEGRAPVS
jgi:hypothetical protein